ncbi:hypothetical protein Tco_1051073 [Tanacetum coccineum]
MTPHLEAYFKAKMGEIKEIDEKTYDYLIQRNPNSLCRAFFSVDIKCPTFKNRISESYHKAIIVQRSKPIIIMLEDIMIYLMKRLVAMSKNATDLEDTITPSVRRQLVNLKKYQRDPDVGVSQRYSQEKWLSAYQFSIKHVCGTSMWKRTGNQPPIPPILRKMPGRPRKNRIKGPSKNNSQVNRGRGSRVEVVIEVLEVHMLVGVDLVEMEEAEVRRNLEHEYMEYILMDEEEMKLAEEKEVQDRQDEEALQQALEEERFYKSQF